MPYISSIAQNQYTIDTGEDGHQRTISLDGLTHSIDWVHLASLAADAKGQTTQGGRFSLLIAGKSYDVFARRLQKTDEDEGLTYEILVAGQRFEVHVEDERARALIGSLKSAHQSGEIIVRAPMPGLVLHVLHAPGARVEMGQPVVILEAMKMENDLSTPRGGVIKEVRVAKGQTVNQGDALVVITGE